MSSAQDPYIEFLIEEQGSCDPFLHNKLALLYKERISYLERIQDITETNLADNITSSLQLSRQTEQNSSSPLYDASNESANDAESRERSSKAGAFSSAETEENIVGKHFVSSLSKKPFIPANEKTGEIGYLHMRLIFFLKYSRCYVPEELLTPFRDNDDFFEEQVILLSKCRQHKEALTLLVEKMMDLKAAEDYCEVFYDPRPDAAHRPEHNIHQTFLHVLLECNKMEVVTEYLVRYFAFFQKKTILDILPQDLSLSKAIPFLTLIFQSLSAKLRNTQIQHSLLRSEDLLAESRRVKQISRRVEINPATRCARCHSVFQGRTAVAVAPDNSIYHLHCYE